MSRQPRVCGASSTSRRAGEHDGDRVDVTRLCKASSVQRASRLRLVVYLRV